MENKAPTNDRIDEEYLRNTRAELTAFIKENNPWVWCCEFEIIKPGDIK